MSLQVDESLDFIPGSSDSDVSYGSEDDVTPISRNKAVFQRRPNKNNVWPSKLTLGKNEVVTVPDSDEEVEVLSSNSSSNEILESSVEKSCISSSDFDTSQNTPCVSVKPKKSFIKELPSCSNKKILSGNASKHEIISSTPTFDPLTPAGGWRVARKNSLSDDESPIGNVNRERRIAVIDSDSEEELSYSPKRLFLKESHKNEAHTPVEDQINHSDPLNNTQQTDSFVDAFDNLDEKKLSSTGIDSEIDSPKESIKDLSKGENTSDLYRGKFKIKSRSRDKQRSGSSNENDVNNLSCSSANTSTSSVSSVKSLNLSNMSQAEMKSKLKSTKLILKTANLKALPDRGAKLKDRISELEEALSHMSMESIKEDEAIHWNDSVNSNSSVGRNQSANLSDVQIISEDRDPAEENLRHMKDQLREKQMLYKATNPRSLPDGGARMKQAIATLEREIMMVECKAKINSQFESQQRSVSKPDIVEVSAVPQYRQTKLMDYGLQTASLSKAMAGPDRRHLPHHVLEALYDVNKDYGKKDYGGKLSQARERDMYRMTTDAVAALHQNLKSMPDVEQVEEEQPDGLKVTLMPHQRRALAWLLWRESLAPPGGILADDMGLGKTLTMLSLILRHKELLEEGRIQEDFSALGERGEDGSEEEEEEEDEWMSKGGKGKRHKKRLTPSKGTLVVCPASLLGQWEGEAKRRVSRKKLCLFVYHGNSREISLSRLAQYDIVVTTYQLVMREAFSGAVAKNLKSKDDLPQIEAHDQGPLFRIGWTRIILDEAHQIRNHKSKTAQSACMLRGGRRWAVTGTPVQNKELDMYSLIRFLRVSPFDDYTCWKYQLNASSAHGLRKLNLLVRALLLRRNKDQVDINTGEAIVKLPPKEVVQHKFSLEQDEREVYDRVFAFSRSSLIQYMKSQEEKEMEKMEKLGKTYKPQFAIPSSIGADKYTPTLEGDILNGKEMKAHHMLVLLLRLRQICCHPALISGIIDEESRAADGLKKTEPGGGDLEVDLVTQMNQMDLRESVDDEEVDRRVRDEVLNADNPVFKKRTVSSKIARVIDELKQVWETAPMEKAVIVSQWTSMLQIVARHLKKAGVEFDAITGQIPVKERAAVVDSFNEEGAGPKVLLLSLAAGGVGLNLVGANHLFLLDMHWNPQLEAQACDRIYRVGQKRPVKIHRFVVENTVEQKILELQQKKMDLADSVLTGAKRTQSHKLTLQDIQALFSIT